MTIKQRYYSAANTNKIIRAIKINGNHSQNLVTNTTTDKDVDDMGWRFGEEFIAIWGVGPSANCHGKYVRKFNDKFAEVSCLPGSPHLLWKLPYNQLHHINKA